MALDLRQGPARPAAPAGRRTRSLWRPSVTTTERLFFTEQLELLLATGVNLHAALDALRHQASSPAMRELLTELSETVETGRPFSEALAGRPDVFNESYVNLVRAAEAGGFLHEVLERLLEMEEKREQLRSTLMGALSYPMFLALFSTAVTVFILVVVFPKFGKMFVSIRDQLPPTTLALMWTSDVLRQHWALVLGGLGALALLLRQWLGTAAGRQAFDRLKLRGPVFRGIFVPVYLVQMLRTMGTSLANGVSVVDTLSGCRNIVDNVVVRQFLSEVEGRVREGANFSNAFQQAEFLPPLVRRMIVTGDQTGNLSRVMLRVGDYYERDLGKRLQKLAKTAEPIMLLVMGTVVGVLVSSLILPIFKLTRAVG